MKFGAKRDPLLAQLGFFRAKFHSKSLYSVEKKIVGISQYAYFRLTDQSRPNSKANGLAMLKHLFLYFKYRSEATSGRSVLGWVTA
jgi:hypothetical protein